MAEQQAPTCRVVGDLWVPGTPLLLPCETTVEPCDGLDNDYDGFMDPHCPTRRCQADADCTHGGLVPDVDCNPFAEEPHCAPIDGTPDTPKHSDCFGRLCPPGKKCVEGDCVEPGTGLPGSVCTSGRDCPINAGCIPFEHGNFEDAECLQFCHDHPCPTGFYCLQEAFSTGMNLVESASCSGQFGCDAAIPACIAQLDACRANETCDQGVTCALTGCELDELSCVLECLAPGALRECVTTRCTGT